MSEQPAAVWYAGSVLVSAGSISANFGRHRSLFTPRFLPSYEITLLSLISLPDAASVSTTPSGKHAFGVRVCS